MSHLVWMMAIAIALVVVAALLRLSPDVSKPHVRLRLRRTVVLFVPYLVLGLLATYGGRVGSGLWLSVVTIAADFLVLLLIINLAAAFIFDFALRMVRLDAASAGFRVGYEDPSYFSREYKKLFGAPPQRDIAKLRSNLEL